MTTTESGSTTPASATEVGRHLRAVRKAKGLSRAEVARSAGLTRRELAAYERGRTPVPDSDLWCLAGSCGVDVAELQPYRVPLGSTSDFAALTVGDSVRRLRTDGGGDGILREYLAMIYELRNLPPGTRPPLRDDDLANLASALGGTPDAIEARLHELIGASREEASRLRRMILTPRPIAAPAATDAFAALEAPGAPAWAAVAAAPVGATGPVLTVPGGPIPPSLPEYAPPQFDFASAPSFIGDPEATARYFDTPVADDPFAPPPPLAPPIGGAWAEAHAAGPIDPFAPPTVPPIDPFGPPTTAPIDPFATPYGLSAPAAFASPPVAPIPSAAPVIDPNGAFAAPAPDDDAWERAAFGSGAGFGVSDLDPSSDGLPAVDFGSPSPADPVGAMDAFAVDVGSNGHVHDPFAALRVPVDESDETPDPAPLGTTVDTGFDATLDPALDPTLDPALDPALDPPFQSGFESGFETGFETTFEPGFEPGFESGFETAFEVEVEAPTPDWAVAPTTPRVDDDLGDDWFDRAAAAADALIAEQHVEPDVHTSSEPSEGLPLEMLSAEPLPLDAVPVDALAVEALARAETTDLAPSPITWSLEPPAESAPATNTPTRAAVEVPRSWTVAGPDWQIGGIFPATAMADDGTLALRRADVRWALADLDAESDFTLVASVNFTSGAGFGILFRVSADDTERITGYSFDVDPVYSGGGFLVRQWNDSRQHWKPLAHTPVAETARLYGAHVIEMSLRQDALEARIDGELVMTMPHLSRASLDAGHEPCRGTRVGVQAWSTTEVTVDRMMLQRH